MNSGRGADLGGAAGGPARHVPVLLDEVLRGLRPHAGARYFDGTFGAGGYARALLAAAPVGLVAIDRDPEAVAGGETLAADAGGRLTLVCARFRDILPTIHGLGLSEGAFAGVVFDLGVSSMQLDQPERGFSFLREGPLDMRMSRSGRTAADLVNEESQERIADILFQFGEERAARRIARAIVQRRARAPFVTTRELVEEIARAAPARPTELHPATRSFQALRIAVNDELTELTAALEAAERLLAPGGRLAVVSFHSLEDRIVKQFFAARTGRGRASSRLLPGEAAPPAPTFRLVGSRPIVPSDDEIARNPRARSAKLRIGERTEAAAGGGHDHDTGAAPAPGRTRRR